LNFCLNDGSVLSAAPSPEAKTVFFESPRKTNEYGARPQFEPPAVWQNQPDLQRRQFGAMATRPQNLDRSLPIISLVLGVLSLIPCFIIGIPLGIGAIITGAFGIRNENSEPNRFGGRGLAVGGIVLGAIGVAMGFLFFIFFSVS
jgi:hypothetical protein